MTDQEFKSANKELLLEGAQLCYKNAGRHFACAEQIALNRDFGIANSLLILSSEECIKSMVLAAGFFSVNLTFPVDTLFKFHRARHEQAKEMQPFISSLIVLSEGLTNIFKARKPSKFGLGFDVLLLTTFVSIIEKFFGKKEEEPSDFWERANDNKNKGFYVDFKQGAWVSPSTFNDEYFVKSVNAIKPFLEITKFIEQVKPDDYKEFENLR